MKMKKKIITSLQIQWSWLTIGGSLKLGPLLVPYCPPGPLSGALPHLLGPAVQPGLWVSSEHGDCCAPGTRPGSTGPMGGRHGRLPHWHLGGKHLCHKGGRWERQTLHRDARTLLGISPSVKRSRVTDTVRYKCVKSTCTPYTYILLCVSYISIKLEKANNSKIISSKAGPWI